MVITGAADVEVVAGFVGDVFSDRALDVRTCIVLADVVVDIGAYGSRNRPGN